MSELNAFRPLLEAWSQLVNEQDIEVGRGICDPDIRCIAFHEGVGGPATEISGFDAIADWVRKPERGRYGLAIQWDAMTRHTPDPRLPASDHTLSVPFTVTILTTDWAGWTNEARWIFALRGGRIVGLVHEPQALTDAQMDLNQLPQDF